MRLVKSPASPTINQLGFRDVGKSGVAFSRGVSGCSNRAGLLNAARQTSRARIFYRLREGRCNRSTHGHFIPHLTAPLVIFPQCQIAQFDCSVCTSEEADEAGTYRDDPRRIGIGHNPDVNETSLQHNTAKCTAKPKNDPNNKDERRLQGFFHCRSQGAGPRIHAQSMTQLKKAPDALTLAD